ncbi:MULTISPECIES: murein L,D-transpeptidase catalytic domain family protein [Legionella]|uniref:Murein L,D-transpeptidase catalytic domain family protein n=1 Tax=Legionella septentrionalis TaxID=2498109 RepID=A0A433JI74_9GAMM|nr:MULTISPECIES: murein L,D-transpeptidase catalytic domain family protein [Legionella]MCP0913392.1 murein L,D-transpeptidase catalytic domain family protein [Legionella sp. 27cVA30]RUQ84964.1 murein L,D-transpeptidase catalytic domain family protein [Legionella septentrionalis]RUR08728.1 murein L,D-transpeptidase catalytic domain family protein [Legionella septentrionalis]
MLKLLVLLAVLSTGLLLPFQNKDSAEVVRQENQAIAYMDNLIRTGQVYPAMSVQPFSDIRNMLEKEASLKAPLINKVLTILKCTKEYDVTHNNMLTIIDYSLPSSEKRLWIFDLQQKKLLFHTYVSHGINSGALLSEYFSNKYDSKTSSIGVYKTEAAYYGREGVSLKLNGLDKDFNDNASNRALVMHGGWYVEEDFIKKYGRAGRSWGCPAVPLHLAKSIINTIKDRSLFVVYYPSDRWFSKSKFLNCSPAVHNSQLAENKPEIKPVDFREDILFADINKNNQREEHEPIIVMPADSYERVFHAKAPLARMLRRQINNMEYVALSNAEFKDLIAKGGEYERLGSLNSIYFVIPVVKMRRGYYATEMHIVTLGKIKEVKLNSGSSLEDIKNHIVFFEEKPQVNLKATNRFIRWLGL